MKWNAEQLGIFEWFESGGGNLLVRARAGTGKTTTIIEGIRHAPSTDNPILCAFNKRIQVELSQRLDHPDAVALTLHSIGLQAVKRFWPKVKIEKREGQRAFDLAERGAGRDAPDAILSLVAKLHSKGREIEPLATCPGDLKAIAWDHDCVPDDEWKDYGWTLDRVLVSAYRAMRIAKERPTTPIDFVDMIFLPVANNWLRPKYSLVVVDEAQDLNKCQLLIAKKIASGRICVVGDDRQGIYGFRGASGDLEKLKYELQAKELGLSTTYRCARAIVNVARTIVPDYRAHESNPDGIVRTINEDDLLDHAKPMDAVLSRLNAPLVTFCLKALRRGIPARVEGRDVAAGIRKLVKDLATGPARNSIPKFLVRLGSWEVRQIVRAQAGGGDIERKVEAIADKCEALRNIAEGVTGIPELQTRINEVFAEIRSGRALLFSSVHRAKGLEWPRVFVLADTFRDGNIEEENIRYVAYTRAINELVFVEKE